MATYDRGSRLYRISPGTSPNKQIATTDLGEGSDFQMCYIVLFKMSNFQQRIKIKETVKYGTYIGK